MSEERLVPKLRFSGFDDEWNEVKIEDKFDKVRNGFVGVATHIMLKKEFHIYRAIMLGEIK